jgi:hypothetical protein
MPEIPLRDRAHFLPRRIVMRRTGKQAEDVGGLKTCDQDGEFKKRAKQAVLDISGSYKNSDEDERVRRDKNLNLEELP